MIYDGLFLRATARVREGRQGEAFLCLRGRIPRILFLLLFHPLSSGPLPVVFLVAAGNSAPLDFVSVASIIKTFPRDSKHGTLLEIALLSATIPPPALRGEWKASPGLVCT